MVYGHSIAPILALVKFADSITVVLSVLAVGKEPLKLIVLNTDLESVDPAVARFSIDCSVGFRSI